MDNADITNKDDLMQGAPTSDVIKEIFAESMDIVYRTVRIKNEVDLAITLIYIDGMANVQMINDNIVYPLTTSKWYDDCTTLRQAFSLSMNGALDVSSIKRTDKTQDTVSAMLSGHTILIFDKLKSALIIDTVGFDKRSMILPTEEDTFRTGKDSFVETLNVNTATLRRKIKSHNLVIEETIVGQQSHTRICITYMQNICNNAFVEKIKKRLNAINQDKALSIDEIYVNLVKEKYTPFPLAVVTEKPDTCCISLLEGKVAILIDEIPYALILPAVFGDFFQAPSDYAYNFIITSFFRILRNACFYLSILLPGFLVAITSHHPKMIPYNLNVAITATLIGTPFSMVVEVLIMSTAFFVLIQASLQISQQVGATISIVGGLVLGQAAITANIVSPSVIVVVAAAAICSMTIPNKEIKQTSWLFQVLCTILSAVFGLLGVVITWLILFFMLAKLTPLEVPYLSPYTAKKPLQLDDSIISFPTNLIKKRPGYLHPKNKRKRD